VTEAGEEGRATEARTGTMGRLLGPRLVRLLLRMLPVPFVPMPELYDLVSDLRRSRVDLDRQVVEAIEALQRSSQLVSQLEDGLRERSDRLSQLREEYERLTKLAEIEEDKVEALIGQLELTLGRERGRERWFGIAVSMFSGLVFFLAGALLSDPLRGWANALLAWLSGGV
jgi:exonuclease VII small subunit